MKKIFFLGVFVLLFTSISFSQIRTLGLRVGDGELSAQFLSEKNRLEVDLGLYTKYSSVCFSYQKAAHIFNEYTYWYYGAGAIANSSYDLVFSAGPIGILGIERSLRRVPIQFSIDYRPALYLIYRGSPSLARDFLTFGFSMRYIFDRKKLR